MVLPLLLAIPLLATPVPPQDPAAPAATASPLGMAWIPGGEFTMGGDDALARPDERPLHRVRVDGFWMDLTEVTNAQFAAFVAATGYRTVAERPVDWEELKKQVPPGTPRPPDSQLQPGALVFTPPNEPVDLARYDRWWTWTPGACWKHPRGPGSSIEGKDTEPVVHVALEDGFALAAPVKSFPPNGYGLFDMAGNVWEWCTDRYRPDAYALRAQAAGAGGVTVNPRGPAASVDPRNPHAPDSRVVRGGSFLCNDSYCASYRPAARMSQTPDTGMQHLGFRCVKDGAAPAAVPATR